MGRMMAKGVKPRLVISENDGRWTLKTETKFKDSVIEFQPGVEYEEKTADGRLLKASLVLSVFVVWSIRFVDFSRQSVVHFENGQLIQQMRDQHGKESVTTRWVDDKDQQHIVSDLDLSCSQKFSIIIWF